MSGGEIVGIGSVLLLGGAALTIACGVALGILAYMGSWWALLPGAEVGLVLFWVFKAWRWKG
jgi:hypothetical protein